MTARIEFDATKAQRALDDYDRDADREGLLARLAQIAQVPQPERVDRGPGLPDHGGRSVYAGDLVLAGRSGRQVYEVLKVGRTMVTTIEVSHKTIPGWRSEKFYADNVWLLGRSLA